MSRNDEIRRLEAEIRHHRELYYNLTPEITDDEFDTLVEQLQEIAPESPVLAEVGAPPEEGETGLPKKVHKIPMGSLDKITDERLESWAKKAGPLFLVQEKYDGISLEIEYAKGQLVDAITRGDGVIGEVVTHNAVNFGNTPRRMKRSFSGSLRGEVILRRSVFDRKFAPLGFANPRNTVSGLTRKKHGDRSLAKYFEVYFYDIIDEAREFETEREKMEYLRDELEVDIAQSWFDQDLEGVQKIYREYLGDDSKGTRFDLDYEIDGLVVRSDSIELQRELGVRQNRPRWAMAYKFPSLGKRTTLLGVEWSLGIGHRVTPVAKLEPVEIGGVTVTNATLHNLDVIRSLGLHAGDLVYVERRGDVIPQVIRVLESRGGKEPHAPKNCPSCGEELRQDGKFLICTNRLCPGRQYGDLMKWVQELEIDSLGEKWVATLFEDGLVARPADFYSLTTDKLVPLDRMGETLARKIVENIQSTRNPPLDRFVAGLNIPGFSRQRVQMLGEHGVSSLERLRALTVEEIAELKGFGEILGKAIVEGLERKAHDIELLLDAGVKPENLPKPKAAKKSGPFAGKSFCFTGAIERTNPETGERYTRKELEDLVVAHGGKTLSAVSAKLDYLVMADPKSTSTKAKKAREVGTEILSEEAFFKLLQSER